MSAVSVRSVGPEAVDRLEPLWAALLRHHVSCRPRIAEVYEFRTPAESWIRRRARYLEWLEDPGTRVLVAEDPDGSAVGYAVVTIADREQTSVVSGRRLGDLETLVVHEDHRGQGVGEALMEAALEHLRSQGVEDWTLGVMDGNSPAQTFYERFGLRAYAMTMLGRVPQSPGG